MIFFICLFLFLVPAFFIYATNRVKTYKFLSPVILCYGTGILIGNLGLFQVPDIVFTNLSQIIVPLAIPLLLMSTDLKKWIKHIQPIFLSIFIALLGVVLACVSTFFLFQKLPHAITTLGMITGSLIGTNVNLSAVGIAMNADPTIFLLVTSADVGIGAIYLLFLIALGKKVYSFILKPYEWKEPEENITLDHNLEEPFSKKWMDYPLSILIAIIVVGFAALLSFLFYRKVEEGLIIVSISIISILIAFFSKKVRSLKCSDEIGQYLLLVFCLLIGLKANFAHILSQSLDVFYITFCYYGLAILYQLILAKIFKIDVDTTIMTTTGTIYGPVFVGQLAASINNKEVILTGMITAILGYSIGTMVSLAIVELLKIL